MDDRNLGLEMVRVTEAAALACSAWMGRGDAMGADQAAVDAMRRAFDSLHIRGTIVIGEGERDEAPMLYIGEQVGAGWHEWSGEIRITDAAIEHGMGEARERGKGEAREAVPSEGARRSDGPPSIDIAVDPLEGTNLCATGSSGAIAVMAFADDGRFLNAPDTYMEKIAVGPTGRGAIDLSRSASWNLSALAEAKRCKVDELTAVILERPRHEALIAEVRKAGARIRLITDGDVSAAIATCTPSGIDILFGTGGAPEGVLAAAALRCTGGEMQGRLRYRSDEEKQRAERMGVKDHAKIFKTEELAQGDVLFAATGVTDGAFLRGVHLFPGGANTQSVVMRSKSGTVRTIDATHAFERKPNYDWLKTS
jgi:fructose-1,6-bisphosphatase II